MHAQFNHHLKSKQNQTEKYLNPSRKQKSLSLPRSAHTIGRLHREMFHKQEAQALQAKSPQTHHVTQWHFCSCLYKQ